MSLRSEESAVEVSDCPEILLQSDEVSGGV